MTFSFRLSSLNAQIDSAESELLELRRIEDCLRIMAHEDAYATCYPAAMALLEQLRQSIRSRKRWLEEAIQILQDSLVSVSERTEEAADLLRWLG